MPSNAHPGLSRLKSTSTSTKTRLVLRDLTPLPTTIYSEKAKYPAQSRLRRPKWSFQFPLPRVLRGRTLRLCWLNFRHLHRFSVQRFGISLGATTPRGALIFSLLGFSFLCLVLSFFGVTPLSAIPLPTIIVGPPPTLIYQREDLQRIWEWEVKSGHYPHRQTIPKSIKMPNFLENPALPPSRIGVPITPSYDGGVPTRGAGPKRIYLDMTRKPPNVAYPHRPLPGSVADLDIIMEHCDFSRGKYVRDCLEVLRVGGGLDNGRRTRRGRMDDWRYLYIEDSPIAASQDQTVLEAPVSRLHVGHDDDSDPNEGLRKKRGVPWEVPPIRLPPISPPKTASTSCDPDRPRLFHMFWAGPFTDKPYVSLLSFLFTQNLGMHHAPGQRERTCRPQIWLWINPGPAAVALPNPDATRQMEDELKSNPWSVPFLHPRFKDVIQFKLWNTTAQFDSIPELKGEWKDRKWFYSAGKKIASTKKSQGKERAGSTSSSTYDRLSVILSDTARFILCHRFGGIYLDADTLFLRDYTELLNQPSAFAYRWSRLPLYNTAVLKLNKGSALGKMIIKTAVKNGMDFHPMSVARYLKDAGMQRLLVRLPDAMFDSAWLNAEEYQIERPPMPYFTSFEQFFETPVKESAVPQAVGFDGFFKGAYSYHFHNFWWKPFDPVRNFPDLGPRFEEPERKARAAMRRGKGTEDMADDMIDIDVDERDLSWATVLKRTFEAYVRGERPNMYGEWLDWGEE